MSTITIKDLIYIIPEITNLFLSGFIFMSMFNWLNNKNTDLSTMTIWSLFISILVKSFYSLIHNYILSDVIFNNAAKILIYSSTGLILAFIFSYLKKTVIIRKILYHTNNKSINEDIFEDIIDYKKRTMMKIYIKSSDIYYLGKFSYREEKGMDSWIVLIDYYCLLKKDNKITFDPKKGELKSSVAINSKDIERIEIIYENDSEVWKRLSGEDLK